jgi:hypothetical protein
MVQIYNCKQCAYLLVYRNSQNLLFCLQNHCHWTRYLNHYLKSTLHAFFHLLLSPLYNFFPTDIPTKILYVLLVSNTSYSNATSSIFLISFSPASVLLGPNILGGALLSNGCNLYPSSEKTQDVSIITNYYSYTHHKGY